jgi:hypothetical protein
MNIDSTTEYRKCVPTRLGRRCEHGQQVYTALSKHLAKSRLAYPRQRESSGESETRFARVPVVRRQREWHRRG